MSSTQEPKNALSEVIDTTLDHGPSEDHSDSEAEVANDLEVGGDVPAAPSATNKKKKKRGKAKKLLDSIRGKDDIPQELVDRVMEKIKEDGSVPLEEVNEENVQLALREMKIMDVVQGKAGPMGHNKKDAGEHKFWATQPVPQLTEGPPLDDGYIEPSKPREEVRQEPYPLPALYEWTTLDISDPKENQEVHDLLSLHYVEDDHAAFRFQYSPEFLRWALTPPGYHKEWHIGVRVAKNNKLVAFISGVPMKIRVRNHVLNVVEINYLCVHKKLRSKRLAPVLIKEVTRQCHLKGIFQAIYTAGIIIPTPVSVCRYYHRLINIPKLLDTRFCYVPRSMTQAHMIRLNKVPSSTATPGLREMQERDIVAVSQLFTKYMRRFNMSPIFSVEEMKHQFVSGMGTGELGSGGVGRRAGQVTWSYVVENPDSGKITDFFSFYSLPSTVIKSQTYPTLEAAYLYYYATEVGLTDENEQSPQLKARLTSLIGDAIVVAEKAKFDVFNALTLMDNVPILRDLKFGVGDGFLHFYLYNWRTTPLSGLNPEGAVPPGKGVGVVML